MAMQANAQVRIIAKQGTSKREFCPKIRGISPSLERACRVLGIKNESAMAIPVVDNSVPIAIKVKPHCPTALLKAAESGSFASAQSLPKISTQTH